MIGGRVSKVLWKWDATVTVVWLLQNQGNLVDDTQDTFYLHKDDGGNLQCCTLYYSRHKSTTYLRTQQTSCIHRNGRLPS